MKRYTIINLVDTDVRTVSRLGMLFYLRKYRRQAEKIANNSRAGKVVYAILYEQRGTRSSCHVIHPETFTAERFTRCFPKSERCMTPFVASAK